MLLDSMGKYVTVSVKVPREVKEKLEKAGVSPSKVMKEALMEVAKEIELKELEKEIERFDEILSKIPIERVVKSMRPAQYF